LVEQVLVAPFFNAPPHEIASVERIAMVGLAAGTSARQAAVYGDVVMDGFEIDPLIVEVGRTYFDMNQPNLTVYVQDGRWGLDRSAGGYDIISVDAYRPPYIPWHMTTLEFFEIVYENLTEDGVMVINIGRSPLDRTLINDLGTTIAKFFLLFLLWISPIPSTRSCLPPNNPGAGTILLRITILCWVQMFIRYY
jgi:spermidine synthase